MSLKTDPRQTPGTSQIQKYRILFGFRQRDLCKFAGISQVYLSLIERGKRPSLSIQRRLAAALEADVHVLFPDGIDNKGSGK